MTQSRLFKTDFKNALKESQVLLDYLLDNRYLSHSECMVLLALNKELNNSYQQAPYQSQIHFLFAIRSLFQSSKFYSASVKRAWFTYDRVLKSPCLEPAMKKYSSKLSYVKN